MIKDDAQTPASLAPMATTTFVVERGQPQEVLGAHFIMKCAAEKKVHEESVLLAPRVGQLVMGQDLMAGYASQDGVHVHLYLSESIVLMLEEPRAVCMISTRTSASERPES